MHRSRFWIVVAGAAVVAAARTLAGAASPDPPVQAKYVGAKACASCHTAEHEAWTSGRHSRMLQPATAATVKGNFSAGEVTLRGVKYQLRAEKGQFFITESYFNGTPQEHRVEYTLGSRRIQHYLTTLSDGRIVLLPPSWDVQRKEWFHNLEIVRPDEDAHTLVQQWNKSCVGCHVSGEQVNFTPATRSYHTEWTDFGTSCERCHGPGSAHVEANAAALNKVGTSAHIVRPTRLDPAGSTTVCAQCHSLRETIAPSFRPGENYYDYFAPVLEYQAQRDRDPAYWTDGRPRRLSNDAIGLWQSACFLRGGATCTSCHADLHTPDVDRNPKLTAASNNALCTRCHTAIGERLMDHTKHAATSAGSRCVECHMPKEVVSIKTTIRDHTISMPAPENTAAFAIPNACTDCHTDKNAAWAVKAADTLWPERRRTTMIRRATAFNGGRRRSPAALEALIALAQDTRETPWIRANAVGYLRGYSEPAAAQALLSAAASAEPLIRATAVSALAQSGAAAQAGPPRAALIAALDDPRRAVRLAALSGLVNAGNGQFTSAEALRFQRVAAEFAAKATMYPDDAGMQKEVGLVALLSGRFDAAAAALTTSLAVDPNTPTAGFLLALARIGQHRDEEARKLLEEVPKSDPYYATAQDRLKALTRPQ